MLEIEALRKTLGRKFELGPISFSANQGETIGVVGPNGAGKSTFLKTVAGIDRANSGSCILDGEPISSLSRDKLGYMGDRSPYLNGFTVSEWVSFDLTMRGMACSPALVEKTLDSFNMQEQRDKIIETLSQGQAQRLGLCCAFAGSPRLMILDEPINGLDVSTTITLRKRIGEAAHAGTIILISAHVLSYLDTVANRVILLREGKLISDFSTKEKKTEDEYRHMVVNASHEDQSHQL